LVAAGDMIQGSTWANLSKGASVIELMNAMKFDAMVVGNHEFDFGQGELKKRIAEANFPILGANVVGIQELRPYVVKEVDGIRVGILGVVAEDTPLLTNPNNVAGLKFLPPQEAIEKYLPELRKASDMVIVLSHIGHEADRLLAAKLRGVDLIIGGHSHTRVAEPPAIGEAIVLQAWEHGKVLGVVEIEFENRTIKKISGHLREINPSEEMADKTVEEIVAKHSRLVDSLLSQTVGETEVDLDGTNVRIKETNLGNFVADVLRDVSKADVAIINGGAIRTSIPKGEIKAKDIYKVLPFDNYVVAMRLKGRQIHEALEHGISAVGKGGFPQVSGLQVTYDLSAAEGARVTEIRIRGERINPEQEYTVATVDFLAAGGDGYKVFGEAMRSSKDYSVVGGAMRGETLFYNDPGKWLRDIVVERIRTDKKINPRVEGRMVEVKKP
jgi:5'-nucleotidase/UDP-sugar diphosphatase